jgi:hypothetical protein
MVDSTKRIITTRMVSVTPIGTGLTVHLPAAWIAANKISPHSKLRLNALSDGTLQLMREAEQ